jgi:hypothetical protein
MPSAKEYVQDEPLSQVNSWLDDLGNLITHGKWGPGSVSGADVGNLITGGGKAKTDTAKAKPKKKAAAKGESSAQEQEQEQQLVATNDFAQLAKGLISDETAQEAPLQQAVSGQLTAPATSNAVATALAAAGLSPNSPAAQWLNANIAQAQAADQPMAQAMTAYGQATEQGNQQVNQALGNMGTAENLALQTAPEQTWLQSLAAHIQSNMNYYGTIPSWAVGSGSTALPPALQYYLQQTGTGQASGVTPLQNIQVPGAPKNTAAANALPTVGSVPGVTPSGGNPAQPGS